MPKKYVIVGGTKGIGRELANKLSQGDSEVTVLSRHPDPSLPRSFKVDVLDENPAFAPIDGPLNGLIYSVGSIRLKPFNQLKEAEYLEEWRLNFLGALKAIKFYLPHLLEAKTASVLAFSTVAVSQGMSYHASIASSKGALEGLFKSLAAEYAPKIRFNIIAPSLTETGLAEQLINTDLKKEAANKRHPLQRIGKPEDIASMGAFLLQEGHWITGQVIHVDGGLSTLKIF